MMCIQIPGTQVGPQNKGISAVLQMDLNRV